MLMMLKYTDVVKVIIFTVWNYKMTYILLVSGLINGY